MLSQRLGQCELLISKLRHKLVTTVARCANPMFSNDLIIVDQLNSTYVTIDSHAYVLCNLENAYEYHMYSHMIIYTEPQNL